MSDLRPRRSVLYMPAANERALEKAKTHRRPTRSSSTSRTPSLPTPRTSPGRTPCAAASSGEYGNRELTIRCNGLDTPWGADDLARRGRQRRRGGRRSPRSARSPYLDQISSDPRRAPARRPTLKIWAMIETPTAIFDVRAIAAHSAGRRARDGHQRPRPRAPRRARCRRSAPAGAAPGHRAAGRPRGRQGRSSTACTTT